MNVEESLNIGYKIAKIIHNAIETTPNITNNWDGNFKDGPNPFYNQMESGFIIEEYYGNLSRLYTNLGVWNILGSSCSSNNSKEIVLEKIKKRLQLKCIKDKYENRMGCNGPWWSVEAIDNELLPPAIEKKETEYINYNMAKNLWSQKKSEFNL